MIRYQVVKDNVPVCTTTDLKEAEQYYMDYDCDQILEFDDSVIDVNVLIKPKIKDMTFEFTFNKEGCCMEGKVVDVEYGDPEITVLDVKSREKPTAVIRCRPQTINNPITSIK